MTDSVCCEDDIGRSRRTSLFHYGSKLIWLIGVISLFFCLKSLRDYKHEGGQISGVGERFQTNRHLLSEDNPDSDRRCLDIHHINSSQRCQFVKETTDCQTEDGFFQYIRFPYCSLPNVSPLAFTILFLWLLFLFILVGITADDYFCPALTVISDTLKLSPNIAGVTFLAYGNGAPDIFSAVAGFVNSNNTGSLALSALIGAGVFVTTVVVGAVSLSVSYDLNQRPYLRDVMFYLVALAWTFIIIYKKRITLAEAIGFIALYVAYVLVVIIGRVVYQRYKRSLRYQGLIQGEASSITDDSIPQVVSNSYDRVLFEDDVGQQDETVSLLIHEPKHSPVRSVVGGLFTCSSSDFVDSGIFTKVYTVIKIPIQFCLNLTIPVIELNEEGQNWNKWLRVLQCIFTPLFCVFATKGGLTMIGGKFPLAVLVTLLGIIFAIFVALTSRPDVPPKYHKLFAFMSFVASVIWIYTTANEIVDLLRMFGITLKLSNEILGVTLLAWGNSIADLIANVAVAKQGFPQMAIAACFGGPLLNLLLGVGLSCTIATSRNGGTFALDTGLQDYINTSFLAISLASSAIVVPLLGFRIPKWYGIYLILLYIVFLTLSILNETGIIKF